MAKLINTFEKGMYQDSLPHLQPKGTFRYARNMVFGDREAKGYGMSTEESNKLIHDYGKKIVGGKYIESLDATVIFLEDGSIHLFDHTKEESTFVAQDKEFGCNWGFQGCEWIRPDVKTDQPCNEVKVYWSSGCDYYVVNLAEMLNPKRKAALVESIKASANGACGYTCEYFRIMKCVCSPVVTPVATDKGGHSLVSGSYQFAVQLVDNGGNETNWSYITDPISVSSENNLPGEPSHSSIKVHVTALDCRYDIVRIAVIKSVSDVVTAEVVAERGYSTDGITFTYTGQIGRTISLAEVKAKRKTYIRGRELISKDSRLWLYGIRQEKNLNMQKRVLEEGELTFIEIETTPLMVEKYGLTSYERGENYLFGVVYNYCDGTSSPAFLLTPKEGGGHSATSTGSITPPTGEGQKVERPRGNVSGDGAVFGCPGGTCGGSAETRGSGGGEESGDGVAENIGAWDTNMDNLVNAAKCDDCDEGWQFNQNTEECVDCGTSDNCAGCSEDEEALAADGPKLEDIFSNHTDELADANQDQSPTYTNGTFKSAAEKLIDSTNNSEYRVIKADKFTVNISASGGSAAPVRNTDGTIDEPVVGEPGSKGAGEAKGTNPSNNTETQTERTSVWSDSFTDAKGVHLIDTPPVVIQEVSPVIRYSVEKYPDTVDCNGEYLYGLKANQRVELFGVPLADSLPILVPGATGVPSPGSTVDPVHDTKLRLVGLKVVNIPQPTNDDLPKPLCPNNPYSIVMVARDEANSTVQAKGVFCSTFLSNTNGTDIEYVNHGANSISYVDRWVDEGGSRLATGGRGNGYAFYGLDTAIGRVPLSGNKFVCENKYEGQGWRYGLYEKGQDPTDGFNGRRKDQRGARQYVSLNIASAAERVSPIKAAGYVAANTKALVPGATNSVSAMHRESFVYIEPESHVTGEFEDYSFTTDTLNHGCPIPSSFMHYGHIRRDIEDQYGAVTGMAFIKTGVEGRDFSSIYQGISGDTYIGAFSFVKKGYVSDKVGNTFPTPERDRTVCDSPNDLLLQQMGLDWYTTQLPLSGDRSDAKNWAGGHRDKTWAEAYPNKPEFDYYYPKVVKTLITVFIESRINPWLRATGEGVDQKDAGEVYHPKLKNLALDSNYAGNKHNWVTSFINRFYYGVYQPSVAQLLKLYTIKILVNFIIPASFLAWGIDLGTVAEGVKSLVVSPILIAYWDQLKKLLTRDDYLHNMLGLPICRTDDAGGETDNFIEQFEDNFYEYNYDHSRTNTQNVFYAMPLQYNTCDCDDCLSGQTTNEIYYSNKQVQGSQIDFYKRFGALSFLEISADNGKLTNLFIQNGDFFAHTTDGIIPIKYKDIGETSGGMSLLGGELLTDPVVLFDGVTEGVAGLVDPNCAINTPYGYVFLDRPARKLYLFDGRNPKAISSIGLDKLFKNYIDFCELSSCHDEKVESGTYYSIGYDPQLYRILVTKNEMDDEKSFTIGIDLSGEVPAWDGFHDYIPQAYFWDRSNMYMTHKGKIYKAHANDGTYRTFFEKEFPSEIEFVAVMDGTTPFMHKSSTINTKAEKDVTKNLDETFNKIAIYNSTQGTGTMKAVVYGDNRDSNLNQNELNLENGILKLSKIRNVFRFNGAKDNIIKSCKELPLTIKEECKPIETINEVIFDCSPINRQQFEGRVVNDDHLIYRLTYDNDNKTLLRLLNVITEVDEIQQ